MSVVGCVVSCRVVCVCVCVCECLSVCMYVHVRPSQPQLPLPPLTRVRLEPQLHLLGGPGLGIPGRRSLTPEVRQGVRHGAHYDNFYVEGQQRHYLGTTDLKPTDPADSRSRSSW